MMSSFRAWVWRAASRIREDADQWRVSAVADSIEDKTLPEILDGPPSALAGLTERHNQVLSEIFGIQTVAELGSNKYFALAAALAEVANKL